MIFNIGRETKAFNRWVDTKYRWIDPSFKRGLFKAWCARATLKNESLGVHGKKEGGE